MSNDKLSQWSNFINSIANLLTKIIWIALILIIMSSLGKYFISKKVKKYAPMVTESHKINYNVTWSEIDKRIVKGMKLAEKKAKLYAKQELQVYGDKLKERIDKDFLDWYFGYWTQQVLGIKGLYHEIFHKFYEAHPGAKEKITEEVQQEFAKRVLKPAISQMELERIARETVHVYLSNLQQELAQIPEEYHIAKEDWEKYLEGLAITIVEVNGNRSIPLSLKTIAAGTAVSTVAVVKVLSPIFKKIGSKVSIKLAGKAAAKMAAKTGAKVAAKTGGELLGSIIGIGIIIWDIWDHYNTCSENRPRLRESLYEYIDSMCEDLLNSPDAGVMSAIYQLERDIYEALKVRD